MLLPVMHDHRSCMTVPVVCTHMSTPWSFVHTDRLTCMLPLCRASLQWVLDHLWAYGIDCMPGYVVSFSPSGDDLVIKLRSGEWLFVLGYGHQHVQVLQRVNYEYQFPSAHPVSMTLADWCEPEWQHSLHNTDWIVREGPSWNINEEDWLGLDNAEFFAKRNELSEAAWEQQDGGEPQQDGAAVAEPQQQGGGAATEKELVGRRGLSSAAALFSPAIAAAGGPSSAAAPFSPAIAAAGGPSSAAPLRWGGAFAVAAAAPNPLTAPFGGGDSGADTGRHPAAAIGGRAAAGGFAFGGAGSGCPTAASLGGMGFRAVGGAATGPFFASCGFGAGAGGPTAASGAGFGAAAAPLAADGAPGGCAATRRRTAAPSQAAAPRGNRAGSSGGRVGNGGRRGGRGGGSGGRGDGEGWGGQHRTLKQIDMTGVTLLQDALNAGIPLMNAQCTSGCFLDLSPDTPLWQWQPMLEGLSQAAFQAIQRGTKTCQRCHPSGRGSIPTSHGHCNGWATEEWYFRVVVKNVWQGKEAAIVMEYCCKV